MTARLPITNADAAANLCGIGEQHMTLDLWGFPMQVIYEYDAGELPVLFGDNPSRGVAPCAYISAVHAGGVAGQGMADILNALCPEKVALIAEKVADEMEAV